MSTQEQHKVAMIIMAHPDDMEFVGSGTAALWAREGWDVYLVICTDGSGGGPDEATDVGPEARQRTVDTRQQEQYAAARILGLKEVFFLGYPDGQLQPTLEVRRKIVSLLRRYRPTRVICQSPDRDWTPPMVIQAYHPDHMAAGQATLAALYPASQNPWDFPELLEQGLKPHKVEEIYITAAPTQNHAVDISTTLDVKIAALQAHASQIGNFSAELDKMLRTFGAESGKKYGYDYAEEFHRIENR